MSDTNPLYREYGIRPPAESAPGVSTTSLRLVRAYLSDWIPQPGSCVLDIGCGDGELLAALRLWGISHQRGIDLSPSQVARAKSRGLDVECGDALAFLESTKETFDTIFLMDVIEHIPREQVVRFLTGVQRCLKPGGYLVGQTPNGESPEVGTILWNDATHVWCYTPMSVTQVLAASGSWAVECRESVVPPLRPGWAVRWLYWQIRRRLIAINRALEHGGDGSGIYSRVFRFRAQKR